MGEAIGIYLFFGIVLIAIGALIFIAMIKSAINNSELNENVGRILEILEKQNPSGEKSDNQVDKDHLSLSEDYKDDTKV